MADATIATSVPGREALELAHAVLRDLGYEIESKGPRSIRGKSTGNLFTWGTAVEIAVEYVENQTQLRVETEPKAQLFDWGESQEDAEELVRALMSRLEERE